MALKPLDDWMGYVRNCTDQQVRNIFEDESSRAERTGDDDVRVDSLAAMAACGIVAAERGFSL